MTPYMQLCICVLCLLFGLTTPLDLHLDKLCPAQPSPPQDFGLFLSYDIEGPKPECGNSTLYVLHTKSGQHLIERPSPWVTKLAHYLSGRNHAVFRSFTEVAASPTKIINVTDDDRAIFGAHMIPKNIKTLRYRVKDGPDVQTCQMRVTTWAVRASGYLAFQMRIELTSITRKPNTICVRPNLIAGEEAPKITTKPPRK
ncbi:envelope glycoprotein UL130 [Cercopithecine betaherpesvirus 5]|uniref:UL130 n=2 Tax=Simian cytomegalovirus (strain Colburn) TaxID=50292 RepID=D5KLI9_SCMVC|nr:UORF3 [Simian cytomegalovirus]ADE62348.1 UL130 [Cercopithecine betaherpesvirus 5]AEV80654.1 envelope glycoprotein UL130 [Cercopithecine betaherpesvirus 5]